MTLEYNEDDKEILVTALNNLICTSEGLLKQEMACNQSSISIQGYNSVISNARDLLNRIA